MLTKNLLSIFVPLWAHWGVGEGGGGGGGVGILSHGVKFGRPMQLFAYDY